MKCRIVATALIISVVFVGMGSQKPKRSTIRQRLEKLEKQNMELSSRLRYLEGKLAPELKLKAQGVAKRITEPLVLGQVLYFGVGQFIVVKQVLGNANMLADIQISLRIDREFNLKYRKKLVCIRGFSTDGITDGTDFIIHSSVLFQVTGTTTYQTAIGGTNTVLVLEPLEPDAINNWPTG